MLLFVNPSFGCILDVLMLSFMSGKTGGSSGLTTLHPWDSMGPKDFQECFDPRAVGWGREPMRAAFFAYETEARDALRHCCPHHFFSVHLEKLSCN